MTKGQIPPLPEPSIPESDIPYLASCVIGGALYNKAQMLAYGQACFEEGRNSNPTLELMTVKGALTGMVDAQIQAHFGRPTGGIEP